MSYFDNLNKGFAHPLIDEMKEFAQIHQVPIIMNEGLELLIQLILISKAKKVLEVGTAIGYSAISIALRTGVSIDTIERDSLMIFEARKNIQKANLDNRIHLFEGDALLLDNQLFSEYDLIFIDAAKAQYIKFFEKYSVLLKKGGFIFTDNLLFHHLVEEPDKIIAKRTKDLVRKIDQFNHWIVNLSDFQTYLYEIGDGIALSIKK